MIFEVCLGLCAGFGMYRFYKYKKSSSASISDSLVNDSNFVNLKSFLDDNLKLNVDFNLKFDSKENTVLNGHKMLLKLQSRIEKYINFYDLKIQGLKSIDLLDIYLTDKLLLLELYKSLDNLKESEIYLSDLNSLIEILNKLEDVLVLEEQEIEYEEIIMNLLLRSLEFSHLLLKNKLDELSYEAYEREKLKLSIENGLKDNITSEKNRNNYLNDFLSLKKSLLNESLASKSEIDIKDAKNSEVVRYNIDD